MTDAPCPLHERESRAERRRAERGVAAAKTAPGVGRGWRLTTGPRRRRYPVSEPPRVPIQTLIAESDAIAYRLGCRYREVVSDD